MNTNILSEETFYNKPGYTHLHEYWKDIIESKKAMMRLPFALQNSEPASEDYRSLDFEIPADLCGKLRNLSNNNDLGLFIILLAVLKTGLFRFAGNEEIYLSTPLYQNGKTGTESLPANNQVILKDSAEILNLTFKELVLQTKDNTISAYNHQDYPIEMVFKKSAVGRKEIDQFSDLRIQLKNIHNQNGNENLPYKLFLSFCRKEDASITAEVKFRSGTFTQSAVNSLWIKYLYLMEKCLQSPDLAIKDHPLLTDAERKTVLFEFNQTDLTIPDDTPLHVFFEQRVLENPERTAVVYDGRSFSYSYINKKANRYAGLLREKGVRNDSIVAVMIDDPVGMIAAILGIHKAGGCYLALSPDYPEKRLLSILDDSQCLFLLTRDSIIRKNMFISLLNINNRKIDVILANSRKPVTDLDSIQIPDRSLINYGKYSPFIGQAMVKNSIALQFSRGCKFNCAYCFKIWPNSYVNRSAENVFDEMLLYYNMGIRRFAFVDDLPNLDMKTGSHLYNLIIKNKLDVHIHYPNGIRGDILTREYIDLMIQAGVVNIDLALETTSMRLQKLIRKNLNVEKLRENIQYITEKYPHVILELQIIHGIPTETIAEAEDSLQFIQSLKWIHFPYIHILKIYPDTEMARIAVQNGISPGAIENSKNLAYHELPETLPFPENYSRKYQVRFLNEYFFSRERLLSVLPYQMAVSTEDELVQKYNSYLPNEIASFDDLLNHAGIRREELKQDFLSPDYGLPRGLHEQMRCHFTRKNPAENAVRVLLLDLSHYFTADNNIIYDVIDPPLGLMYLMTHLNRELGEKIDGRVLKSRIDFNSYEELEKLLFDFSPDIIGIRSLNFYMDFFHKTVSVIRQWGITAPIIAGGPYATCSYQTVLMDPNIDVAVIGEGEITFLELIDAFIRNGKKIPDDDILRQIDGLAFTDSESRRNRNPVRNIILLDIMENVLLKQSEENLPLISRDRDLAYIIYTSGSTGSPKGVMVQHNNLSNQILGLIHRFGLDHTLKYILLAEFTFDVSVMHIFSPLVSGATLYCIPDNLKKDPNQLVQFISANGISVLNTIPDYLEILLENLNIHKPEIKYMFVGGDAFKREQCIKTRAVMPAAGIINIYGPTETTINACLYEVGEIPQFPIVPIGKPLANYRIYIVDDNLNPVPVGVEGEICIAGKGVARGYLGKPEQNKQSFTKSELLSNDRIYKSGDLGKWLPDGNILFIRRNDKQLKIRGFRIEPEEIEKQLLQHEMVKAAVVTVQEDRNREKNLVAYLVLKTGGQIEGMKPYLEMKLPSYMIPQRFVSLEQFPKNQSGKIDRSRLVNPYLETPDDEKSLILPRNSLEKQLVSIWKEVLGIEQFGITDNFFDLGGHSLKAAILVTKLQKVMNVRIPMIELFKSSTIEKLADIVRQERESGSKPMNGPLTPAAGNRLPDNAENNSRILENITPFNDVFFKSCYYNSLFPVIHKVKQSHIPFLINDNIVYCESSQCGSNYLSAEYLSERDEVDIMREQGIGVCSEDYCEDIIARSTAALSRGNPVILWVDCFYESIRADAYNKAHGPHTLLLYGYDNTGQVFHIVEHANRNSLSYAYKKIGYTELIDAYNGYYRNYHETFKVPTFREFELGRLDICCPDSTAKIDNYIRVFYGNLEKNRSIITERIECLKKYRDAYSVFYGNDLVFPLHANEMLKGMNDIVNAKMLEEYRLVLLFGKSSSLIDPVEKIIFLWCEIRSRLTKYIYSGKYKEEQLEFYKETIMEIFHYEKQYMDILFRVFRNKNSQS